MKKDSDMQEICSVEPLMPSELGVGTVEDLIEEAQESEIARLCQAHTPEMVRSLVEKATGYKRKLEPNEEGFFEIEFDAKGKPKVVKTSTAAAVAAARIVLENAYGRPTQRVEHTGERGGPVLNVTIKQIGDGTPQEIDVSPRKDFVGAGDRSPERLGAA